jgi:predicted nucleotidyltransferase
MDREELLNRIKDRLEDAYGDRLQGIVLYGSEARGEAEPDSDIDLLVLLKGPIELWNDIQTNVHALYDLQLEVIRPIHAMPVDVEVFQAGEYALYRNAKREGVLV